MTKDSTRPVAYVPGVGLIWDDSMMVTMFRNVSKTRRNHPFVNGVYNLFMVIFGMVYSFFTYINVILIIIRHNGIRMASRGTRISPVG